MDDYGNRNSSGRSGKRKVTQDSDTGNRNNEFYKFQTIANITKKESQIHMDQTEQKWKLEAIGIRDLMTDYRDEKALEAFQKSLTTDKEGRCVVSWPWKNQETAPAKGWTGMGTSANNNTEAEVSRIIGMLG
uniref:SGS domain-containing protein n=1 Tax=Loa loa TaxID=7209 RepID=A0A1I7VFU0_LOALO